MVNRAGIRTCQKFVTPQHSRTKGIIQNPSPKLLIFTQCFNQKSKTIIIEFILCIVAYSYDDVNEFVSPPHGRLLEGPEGYAKYKETTDEVLKISATLDDTKKVKYFIYPHLENNVQHRVCTSSYTYF